MQQSLLRFALPTGVTVWPNDLREALAKHDLPPLFFSRDPGTGAPITLKVKTGLGIARHIERHGAEPSAPTEEQIANPFALPGIRIVGAKGWVGILATGERYKPLLDKATVPAIEVVTELCGRGVPVELEQRQLTAEALDYPRRYFIRNLVMKKGLTKDADNAVRIKRRIEQSLERQALAYGLDLPTAEHLGIQVANVHRPRGMRLITSSGVTNQFVGMADVEFYACVNLKGYWFAGNLTSRGYGRIIPDHPAMQQGERAR